MAAPKARNAYDLLLQAIQRQNQQQPDSDLGSTQPGGLLGRLLATPGAQNQGQAAAVSNQPVPSAPRDPSFRQLVRRVEPQTVVAPSIVPDGPDSLGGAADGSAAGSGDEHYAMGYRERMSACVDQCLHLLSSPSGDLQSSEYRQCVGKCMGRL